MTELDLAGTAAATAGAPAPTAGTVLDRFGGWRGLVDGAVPPLAFVVANAAAGLVGAADRALPVAVGAAGLAAVLLGGVRVVQGQALGGVLRGLVGLAVAVAVALWTGRARGFFLPGIYVDAVYGVGLAVSALVGHPAVGHAYAVLFGIGRGWRGDRRLSRVMTVATWGWALAYGLRAVVQASLYAADQPELLGVAKLLLGWPLTAVAVMWTLRAVRRTRTGHCDAH